ncbi:hypothetical protein [Candidatus Poriferisodalis sp.]|uniref:hypothetical protein n=1 Tax=Candidatus Poriferisodalis sp. TaxID=3101277 RepID=UPI003B0270BD
MTWAANVFSGYGLTALAIVAYATWVVRRGRALGRDLGIGPAGAGPDPSRSPTETSS